MPVRQWSDAATLLKLYGSPANLSANHLPDNAPINSPNPGPYDSPSGNQQLPSGPGVESIFRTIRVANHLPVTGRVANYEVARGWG
ncbi:hypothetical protein MTBLM1_130029 [Rhodospirillaceae bacterium LM-1]|nr:hypothetical protein MTBLM1_130029 [Rhodospirillaceae bacterium LM-1]